MKFPGYRYRAWLVIGRGSPLWARATWQRVAGELAPLLPTPRGRPGVRLVPGHVELWSPGRATCARQDCPPDLFVTVQQPAVRTDFTQAILVAVRDVERDRAATTARRMIAEPAIQMIAKLARASAWWRHDGPWGIRDGGSFSHALQDHLLYRDEMPRRGPRHRHDARTWVRCNGG